MTYLGSEAVAIVIAIVAAIGTAEVYGLARARGWKPFAWMGIGASALFVLGAAWPGGLVAWSVHAWILLLVLLAGSLGGAVFLRGPSGDPLPAVATTLFGALYLGVPLSFAVHIRAFPAVSDGSAGWPGAFLVIFPLTVAWLGDTGAYFAGHRFGRRKLLPSVSPAKTVEGAIGGLAGSIVGAAAFSMVLLLPAGVPLEPLPAMVLGGILGAGAQLGDLAESLLKREAGVKDSGTVFPGHGGVLDRFDGIFIALPLTYFLLPYFLS
jgi:phosphatidate cytidylyltransferase